MSDFNADLIQGLKEATDFLDGKTDGARVHIVHVPDVRAIRQRLDLTQQEFATAYHIPLATLKNWEQGRRVPDAPAAAYLHVIAQRPDVIREALQTL